MTRTILCLAAAAAFAAGPAAHAAPEFRAGYGSWRYELSGSVTQDGRTYDLRKDLDLQASGRRIVELAWDTPSGWWPDWSASFTQLGGSGYAEYSSTQFPLPPQPESIAAGADFDDFDLTARYPIRLGALDLAAGVTLKRLRGEVRIDDSGNPPPSRERYDETVPELFAGLRWRLADALVLAASGQGITAGGNRAVEWRAVAELRLKALLLEAGWQEKRYELELAGRALDARLDGALARIGFVWR